MFPLAYSGNQPSLIGFSEINQIIPREQIYKSQKNISLLLAQKKTLQVNPNNLFLYYLHKKKLQVNPNNLMYE